jgi:hypothetical protein
MDPHPLLTCIMPTAKPPPFHTAGYPLFSGSGLSQQGIDPRTKEDSLMRLCSPAVPAHSSGLPKRPVEDFGGVVAKKSIHLVLALSAISVKEVGQILSEPDNRDPPSSGP